MMRAIREPDAGERRHGAFAPRAAVDAGIDHRQLDIAEGVDARQQVELLEDEADLAVAQGREPVGAQRLDALAVEAVAAGRRTVEAADEVHEGRLARARRAHDGDEVACLDVERDAAQRDDAAAVELVDAAEVACLDERHRLPQNSRGPRGRVGAGSARRLARGPPPVTIRLPSRRSPARTSVVSAVGDADADGDRLRRPSSPST